MICLRTKYQLCGKYTVQFYLVAFQMIQFNLFDRVYIISLVCFEVVTFVVLFLPGRAAVGMWRSVAIEV